MVRCATGGNALSWQGEEAEFDVAVTDAEYGWPDGPVFVPPPVLCPACICSRRRGSGVDSPPEHRQWLLWCTCSLPSYHVGRRDQVLQPFLA